MPESFMVVFPTEVFDEKRAEKPNFTGLEFRSTCLTSSVFEIENAGIDRKKITSDAEQRKTNGKSDIKTSFGKKHHVPKRDGTESVVIIKELDEVSLPAMQTAESITPYHENPEGIQRHVILLSIRRRSRIKGINDQTVLFARRK